MSEGLTTEMSVLTEVQNLKDAIRIASGMEYTDPQKIYLMGSSQGGLVTALTAQYRRPLLVLSCIFTAGRY